MPTNTYPVHLDIAVNPADKMLELDILYPGADRLIDFIIINGSAIEVSPYSWIGTETNKLHIVNMTSRDIFVVFTHPTDLTIEDFSIANPVLRDYTRTTTGVPLIPKYAPLHNFLDPGGADPSDDRNYNSPFRTTALNITQRSVIDLKLQPAYDGSVNMIWADDANPIRIVNSRFAVNESGIDVDLIDRRARKDANTYNETDFHQTELIPKAISIPTLNFNGLVPGGVLPGGGYRYFFKYITADGAETDIIEESRLVSVHEGSTTLNAIGSTGTATTNAVSFSLTDLDQSFYGVVVYFTISIGEVDAVDTAFRISAPYIIENGGTCSIIHTGYEPKELIDIDTLSLTYSVISRSKTLDVVNNRLLVGNSDSLDRYNQTLAEAAASLKIEEDEFEILHHSELESSTSATAEENYSNAKFIYDKLGYWKGETYELGVVYITEEGNSPVYPIQGIDSLTGAPYNDALLGGIYRGFGVGGQNSMGVYRTQNRTNLWDYEVKKLKFSGTNLKVDIEALRDPALGIKGFFFVRRKRKKDVILQGLMTPVAAVPIETKFGPEYEISGQGNYCGVGVTSNVAKGNVKYVPAPLGMMPFGVEEVQMDSKDNTAVSTDFHIKAPIADFDLIKSMALYSPDIECAPSYYASIFNGNKVGIGCTRQKFIAGTVNAPDDQDAPIGVSSILYSRIDSELLAEDPLGGDKSAYASYIGTGAVGVAPKGFSGSIDRNIYCYWGKSVGDPTLTSGYVAGVIAAATEPYTSGGVDDTAPLAQRPGNALAYGRYLGLKMDGSNPGVDLADLSITPVPVLKNTRAYNSLFGWLDSVADPDLGYVTSVYNSTSGNPLGPESWKARYLYDEDSEYIAVTKRYRVDDFEDLDTIVPIYGGDCFLGLSWKQVWHPLGIEEAPQTNDVTAYKTTRRALGLLPYGYAIPVPAQSNFNFNVRTKERADEREYKVYGTDRSFLPIRGKDSIRGNRQYETGAYNYGYSSQDRSASKQFRLNVNAPFYKFKYPNRVYVSSESSENEFVNGFSNFKGLNFKDYNTDLGAITKLIALNNVLIAVFKDGVAQIGVDERSVISQDTGGIFVDAANILSRSNVLNSDYGCSHLHGVCVSNNFAYGVDFARQKVWRTNGQALEIISDLKIQNKLGSISKTLLPLVVDPDHQWLDVFSHFDSKKNELYFTFTVVDDNSILIDNTTTSRTLVFNETIQLWVCETDDARKFVFQSNEIRYAFPALVGKYNKLYRYSIINQASTDPTIEVFGEYNKFYDEIYDMYYDYHVLDEQYLYKIYSNIYVVGNNSLPSSITYTSDYNFLTTQVLKPYTNVRYPMIDIVGSPIVVNGTAGSQTLAITQTVAQIHATQRDLSYGDFISVIGADAHTTYKYVVISYTPGVEIIVDKKLTVDFIDKQLYFGYGSGYPLRLNDSAFEESYGVITCQFNNRFVAGQSATKLRGKWMRFRHLYEGTAPVYISGIITDYGVSLS